MAVQQEKKNITEFIRRLTKQIPITAIEEHEVYYLLQTEKAVIILYLPGTFRMETDQAVLHIHIDYDQLMSAGVKIINRLRGLQGFGQRIYGRTTVVARIDKGVSMAFQEEHHLQGALPGKYRYGLFHQGELVSVAVFSGGRIIHALGTNYRSFELIRFCHKGDTLVVGGLSKLVKAFVGNFNPQDIMTYADKDWAQEDSSLATIGFKVVADLPPQRFAIIRGRRFITIPEGETADYFVENKGSLKLKLIL
ncbi:MULTISPECIES: hypothetical protein [Sphingobacterium]|uniref:hypothetical protein n=1 Tax=Sphingobacterium TaxID=28453 RepID=UPI0013D9438D|nr:MULTISPECIES: hypothetical protein [unclassified Sphingobacterium]